MLQLQLFFHPSQHFLLFQLKNTTFSFEFTRIIMVLYMFRKAFGIYSNITYIYTYKKTKLNKANHF